ncbi:MAG: ribosome-associated translation inhibitor RaiA [Clostridia bacterium]|nr:ribosome-associated translation inhibitor RaiA [Clostridia bacterium]
MRIEIIERNYQASQHLIDVVEKKISKLDKYFETDSVLCKVSFKKESTSLKLEVMLEYEGKLVRAQVVGDNFYENIDKVLPKLEGQIRKYRTRFDKQQKNNAFKDRILYESFEEIETTDKVVKVKQFKLEPMTVEQAIEEMELLGHSFFVFFDSESKEIKVLYLRSDGELGLIEPKL